MNPIKRFLAYREHNRLSYRLVLAVVICSVFFTLLVASVQLYFNYRRDVESIHQNIQFIKESYLQAIASSVYNFDQELLRIQLEGALQLHDVIYLEVTEMTEQEQVFMTVGQSENGKIVTTTFPLNHADLLGQTFPVGSLTVIASLDGVYHRLGRNAILILISTTIQTFLVAFVILVIIQLIVTRPLIDMARYTKQLDIEHLDTTLKIRRRRIFSTKPDELDQVINAMNDLRVRLQQDTTKRKQTEEELRKEHDLIARIAETSPAGIVLVNRQGHITFANAMAEQVLGLTRNKITQRTYNAPEWHITDYDGNPFPDEQLPFLQVMTTSQAVSNVHHAIEWPDGRRVLLSINAAPLFDEADQIDGMVATLEDITERKRAEEALKASELRFRSLIEQTTDAVFCYEYDPPIPTDLPLEEQVKLLYECTLVECNDVCARSYGARRTDEVIGKKLTELFGTAPGSLDHLFTVLIQGDYHAIDGLGVEKLEDGTERYFLNNGHGVVKDGKLLRVWGTFRDITERKRAEEALQESEEKFRTLAEQSPSMIFINKGGRVVYVNKQAEELMGYTKEEYYATDFDFITLIAPEYKDLIILNFRKHIKGEELNPYEYALITKTGKRIEAIVTTKLISYEGESAILGIVTNITERKQAEEQIQKLNAELEERVKQRTAELEAVNKELKSFAYVVSHDLKTPLRGISHLAHWLVDDYAEAFDEKGNEMTNLLIGRVKRMDSLIDGILQYSRVGRIVAEEEQIDLNTLVRNVIDSLSLPEHIQVIIEQDLPGIVGDKIRFIQVFQNLIGNALEFMDKPEGKITIGCVDEGSHWTFKVADNGPGIDEKYHEKIFQIFQTLKSRHEHESTGIGLALVRKIVELYGGKIWVESTPGEGSVFSFTFPKKR